MATRAPVTVTRAATNLTTGLTAGQSYVAQNTGVVDIQYANYATDPTDENVGWHFLRSGDFIIFEAEAANPVWVRSVSSSHSQLVVSDA